MRLLLCGPDALEVIDAIASAVGMNGDETHLCDHGLPFERRLEQAQAFAPDVGVFYLPLDPNGEIEEGRALLEWRRRVVCLMTDPRSQSVRAEQMGATALLEAPFDLEALERAIYGEAALRLRQ